MIHFRHRLLLSLLVVAGMSLIHPASAQSTWTNNDILDAGNWFDLLNWNNGVPNSADAEADFGPATVSGTAPTLGSTNATIGSLNFNSSQAYSIGTTTGRLNLQVSSGNATILMGNTGSLALARLGLFSNLNIQTTSGNSSTLSISTSLLSNNNSIIFNGTGTGTLAIATGFSGTGSITQASSGTLVLSGTNNFGGGVNLNSGTLDLNSNFALGNLASVFTINGGTIDNTKGSAVILGAHTQKWNGDFTFTGSSSLNLGTAGTATINASRTITVNANTLTYNGLISDGGGGFGLTKAGAGTLALTPSGSNTYSGITTIIGGTLSINSEAVLGGSPNTPTPGRLVINGGTLQTVGSFSFPIFSDRGIALGPTSGSGSGTIDTENHTVTYGGIIAYNPGGSGGLTKAGGGQLILTGANTYTGATIVNGGVLEVDGSLAAASAVTINGGYLGGTGTVGAVTTNAGGALLPGSFNPISGTDTGTLTVASLTTTGTTLIAITLSNTDNTSTSLNVTSTLMNSGGSILFDFEDTGFSDGTNPTTYTLLNFGSNLGFSVNDFSYQNLATVPFGVFELNSTSLQFVVVPEPATWTLMTGAMVLGLAVVRRKKPLAQESY